MEVDSFIELQISNGDLIQSALLIYLLPLFFFIASALLVKSFLNVSEIILIVTSIVFAAVGFVSTRIIANKLFPNKQSKDLIVTQINK